MDPPPVALLSTDLLFASRLRAALAGTTQVTLVRTADVGNAHTVFVDLNGDVDARLDAVERLSQEQREVIGFCNHDEREVRVRAMARGARQVVTNGALQEAARRILQAPAADG